MIEIEMTVTSIRSRTIDSKRVLILADKSKKRYLHIVIATDESTILISALQGDKQSSHNAYSNIYRRIDDVRGTISKAVINSLEGHNFGASLVVDLGKKEALEIKCSAPDAIAIATSEKVPIYAKETLMEQASIQVDDTDGPYNINTYQK